MHTNREKWMRAILFSLGDSNWTKKFSTLLFGNHLQNNLKRLLMSFIRHEKKIFKPFPTTQARIFAKKNFNTFTLCWGCRVRILRRRDYEQKLCEMWFKQILNARTHTSKQNKQAGRQTPHAHINSLVRTAFCISDESKYKVKVMNGTSVNWQALLTPSPSVLRARPCYRRCNIQTMDVCAYGWCELAASHTLLNELAINTNSR